MRWRMEMAMSIINRSQITTADGTVSDATIGRFF
jgi:hypothetical protein